MKAGWSWGVSAIDSEGRTIWIADAHRADSETARLWRSVVRAIFAQLMPTGGCRLNKNSTGIPGNGGTPSEITPCLGDPAKSA
jgi:hypothetical protein